MDSLLTNCSNYLRFHSKLIRKATCKVIDTAPAVTSNVRYLADMIEHMPTCKKENCNQTDSGPEISVLENWKNVWRRNREKGEYPHKNSHNGNESHIIHRPDKLRFWALGKVSINPRVKLVGCYGTTYPI